MVIAIDASRANRDHKSGTEWYAYYLIRWFARLDSENQYILYTDKPLKNGLADLTNCQDYSSILHGGVRSYEYDKDGYQVVKSPHNNFRAKVLKWPYRYLWTQGRLSLEMLFNKPDVLFVPAHTLPIIHPKRSVVTIHDVGYAHDSEMYDDCEEHGPQGAVQKRVLNLLVRVATFGKCGLSSVDYLDWSTKYGLKKASKVLTISNFSFNDILGVYGEKFRNKMRIIHNGFNKYLYKSIDDKEKIQVVLDKYNIDSEYLFYIGRIDKKKNILTLIEAFAFFKDKNKESKLKLVLAGDAGFGYSDINYLVSEYRLEDDVIMTGWVDEVDVPCLYSGAAVFVFPSSYEGFGIPLLQSMACGVPCAASDRTSIPEIAGDAALLFDCTSASSIARAVEKIVSNKDIRDDLVKKGYKRASEFSWEKCARETLSELLS